MVDYTRGTGSGGTMLIRDLGSNVEFYVQSGSSQTFVGSPGFGTSVYADTSNDGVYNPGWIGLANVANYSNREWRYLGVISVPTTQDINFHINASGTSGFGGPTDFWQRIDRATVPGAPIMLGFSDNSHTESTVSFLMSSDGGAPIREWQVTYGYDPNVGQYSISSSGVSRLGPFVVGSNIYAWARGRNDVGWGPWSARATTRLLSSGRVKVAGVWREFVLYIKVAGTWRSAIIYQKKDGVWTPTKGD